jgi:hypothetical protein
MRINAAEVHRNIKAKVALKFGGDDKRTMHDLAVDLINASDLDWKEVANGCYLCKSTVANLASQKTRFPRADTLERVFKFFEYGGTLQAVTVSAKNANKKKK